MIDMKRIVIFTLLFPPLAAVVFIVLVTPDVVAPGNVLEMVLFFLWISMFAYPMAVVPACVDWALSEKPFYLPLVATMIVAAILAVLMARYLGQRGDTLTFAAMGA